MTNEWLLGLESRCPHIQSRVEYLQYTSVYLLEVDLLKNDGMFLVIHVLFDLQSRAIGRDWSRAIGRDCLICTVPGQYYQYVKLAISVFISFNFSTSLSPNSSCFNNVTRMVMASYCWGKNPNSWPSCRPKMYLFLVSFFLEVSNRCSRGWLTVNYY